MVSGAYFCYSSNENLSKIFKDEDPTNGLLETFTKSCSFITHIFKTPLLIPDLFSAFVILSTN